MKSFDQSFPGNSFYLMYRVKFNIDFSKNSCIPKLKYNLGCNSN